MKLKLILLVVSMLCAQLLWSQYDGISVPILPAVQKFDDIKNLIPIYCLSRNDSVFFKMESSSYAPMDQFQDSLVHRYTQLDDFFQRLGTRPELIISGDMKMMYAERFLLELEKLKLNNFLLSARSADHSRTDPLWTTGLTYWGNELNEAFAAKIEWDTKQSLWTLVDARLLPHKNEENNREEEPPPPPILPHEKINKPEDLVFRESYPYSYTKDFWEWSGDLNLIEINILPNDSVYFKDKLVSLDEMVKILSGTRIRRETFFMLSYDENAKYQSYINVLYHIRRRVFADRRAFCQEKSIGDYYHLVGEDRSLVELKIPENIIEKRLVYD